MKKIKIRKKKVALIGNMNNNNFTLLRILRDNKIDAHLFLYSNETFQPQADTKNYLNWRSYIHNLNISNGKPDILFFNKNKLSKKLQDFNFIIGNGIAPYILKKINRKLDIFMPYAEGIEHINENTDSLIKILLNKPNLFLKNVWFNICALLQKLSIDNCDSITTFNLHNFSLKTFENLGVKPSLIPLFTFYHKEHIPKFDKKNLKKIF